MSEIQRHRLRLAMGSKGFDSHKDELTNGTAKSWRGTDVQVEVALFADGELIDNAANITALYLTVSAGGTGLSDPPLLQKELVADDFSNTNLTAQEWATKEAEHCHALFELSHEETQFDFSGKLANNNKRSLTMTVHGVTAAGATPSSYVTFGYATWEVYEDGVQNELDVLTSERQVQIGSNGLLQVKHPETEAWHNVKPAVVGGFMTLDVEQEAAG